MTSRRLGRLVRLKKLAEQSKAAELADETRSLDEAVEAAEEIRSSLESMDEPEAEASADDLVAAQAWQGHLADRLAQQREAVAEREATVERRQQEVHSAWQQRRLLEGVRNRAAAGEQQTADSAERKDYEAIALTVYGRRKGDR